MASALKAAARVILKHPLITWWLVACASMMLYPLNGKMPIYLGGQRHVCGNTAVNSPFAYLFAIVPWSVTRSGLAVCVVNGIATAVRSRHGASWQVEMGYHGCLLYASDAGFPSVDGRTRWR